MNDRRLTGILDSQVGVIADKQVAQIGADRKTIPSISFDPLQRTSLMMRTRVYLGTDNVHCVPLATAALRTAKQRQRKRL